MTDTSTDSDKERVTLTALLRNAAVFEDMLRQAKDKATPELEPTPDVDTLRRDLDQLALSPEEIARKERAEGAVEAVVSNCPDGADLEEFLRKNVAETKARKADIRRITATAGSGATGGISKRDEQLAQAQKLEDEAKDLAAKQEILTAHADATAKDKAERAETVAVLDLPPEKQSKASVLLQQGREVHGHLEEVAVQKKIIAEKMKKLDEKGTEIRDEFVGEAVFDVSFEIMSKEDDLTDGATVKGDVERLMNDQKARDELRRAKDLLEAEDADLSAKAAKLKAESDVVEQLAQTEHDDLEEAARASQRSAEKLMKDTSKAAKHMQATAGSGADGGMKNRGATLAKAKEAREKVAELSLQIAAFKTTAEKEAARKAAEAEASEDSGTLDDAHEEPEATGLFSQLSAKLSEWWSGSSSANDAPVSDDTGDARPDTSRSYDTSDSSWDDDNDGTDFVDTSTSEPADVPDAPKEESVTEDAPSAEDTAPPDAPEEAPSTATEDDSSAMEDVSWRNNDPFQ